MSVETSAAKVRDASVDPSSAPGDPREFIPVIVWGVVDRETGSVLEAYVDVHEGIADENFEERARELGIELDAAGEPRAGQVQTMFWRSSELGRSEHLFDEADELAAAVAEFVRDHRSVPAGESKRRSWDRMMFALRTYRDRWESSGEGLVNRP